MEFFFTAAVERALIEAAQWRSAVVSQGLETPALLLGLLAESECRAAILLARQGIDAEKILSRWPKLTCRRDPGCVAEKHKNLSTAGERLVDGARFPAEIQASLAAVSFRLANHPRPLTMATEHVLLGLVAADHETAVWLLQQGISPEAIEHELHRQNGSLMPATSAGVAPSDPIGGTAEEDGAGTLEENETEFPKEGGNRDVPSVIEDPPICSKQQLCRAREEVADVRSTGFSRNPGEQPPEGGTTNGISPAARGIVGEGDAPHQACRASSNPPPCPALPCWAVGELSPSERLRALRVLDAAANRAREGLRVVEDYARFVLDDRHLTEQFKRLRHDLVEVVARVPMAARLAARETRADVGTSISVPTEQVRPVIGGVLAANMTRLQEALRSMEEFGKTLDGEMAARLEQLRYRSYTLQRAVELTRINLERMKSTRLYVLLDGRGSMEEFAVLARSLVDAGVDMLQFRDKKLDDRRLLERARVLREITWAGETVLIVDDRPDLAVLAKADGVHIGQKEMAVKDARTIVGDGAIVGVSTHSVEQARQAVLDGADYIGVGPTFPSGTKDFAHFPGVGLLRAVAAEIRLPAFAIGGITPQNLSDVLAAGFGRVAVSGAITAAIEPAAVAGALRAALHFHSLRQG
jgi:thiamine-phosphate pyrophosphorylase